MNLIEYTKAYAIANPVKYRSAGAALGLINGAAIGMSVDKGPALVAAPLIGATAGYLIGRKIDRHNIEHNPDYKIYKDLERRKKLKKLNKVK